MQKRIEANRMSDNSKKEECLLDKPHASAVSVERKLIERCQCPKHKDSEGEKSVCEGSGTLGANKDRSVADSKSPEQDWLNDQWPYGERPPELCKHGNKRIECRICNVIVEKRPEPKHICDGHYDLNYKCSICGKHISEPREDDVYELYLKDGDQYYFKKTTHPFTEYNNMVNLGIGEMKMKREDLMKMIGELRYKIYGYDKEEWFTPLEKQIGYDFKEDLRKILQERKNIKNLGGASN